LTGKAELNRNCVGLIMHHDSLRQGLLKFYFSFVAGVFVLLGFIVSLAVRGQEDFAGIISEVTREFDIVGGIAIILVIFSLCLGIWCLYVHRQLKVDNLAQLKMMADNAGHLDKEVFIRSISDTDIYYTRIFAFSNSMFLLCLIVLAGLFTKLASSFESGLVVTMLSAAVLAVIFYFVQVEVIYRGHLKKLSKDGQILH
jgi:hypothetical protein